MSKGDRLHGLAVFLPARIPDPARGPELSRSDDATAQIEQAVIGVARAVFCEGGHPSISPIVVSAAKGGAHPRQKCIGRHR